MNYLNYLFPIIIILFFVYRLYRMASIKKKLPSLLASGAEIIDVRSAQEFSRGHNPKSINIPLDELPQKAAELDKNKTYILCCASGSRSAIGAGILKSKGIKNVMNAGSWSSTL